MASFVCMEADLCLYDSPLGGQGVRANACYKAGEVLFREKPLVALQTQQTTSDVLVCSNCMKFLGSPELQLSVLLRQESRCTLSQSERRSFHSSEQLTEIHPCRCACGVIYCSVACNESRWNTGGHNFLCTGHISDEEAATHPILAFKIHACSTNEIFLLVADVFAKICSAVAASENLGVDRETAIRNAISPYCSYVRELWWDAAVPPKDSNPMDFKLVLQDLTCHSYGLLSAALDLPGRGLTETLDEEYFARTIGMFEQNNVGIRHPNPLHRHIAHRVNSSTTTPTDMKDIYEAVESIARNIEDIACCPEDDEEEEDEEGRLCEQKETNDDAYDEESDAAWEDVEEGEEEEDSKFEGFPSEGVFDTTAGKKAIEQLIESTGNPNLSQFNPKLYPEPVTI